MHYLSCNISSSFSAANQKETLTLTVKVKEEPKDEDLSSSLSPHSGFTYSHESEARLSSTPDEAKTQETQPNLLTQDISVKAASELLMKLSGNLKPKFNQLIFCLPWLFLSTPLNMLLTF